MGHSRRKVYLRGKGTIKHSSINLCRRFLPAFTYTYTFFEFFFGNYIYIRSPLILGPKQIYYPS